MSSTTSSIDRLLQEGANRLLSRAKNSRGLEKSALIPRLRATLDKYLLRDNPKASPQTIEKFLNNLHADDLCLVIACERGDDAAWSSLMEQFGSIVQSAARSVSESADMAEDLAQSIWAELYGLRVGETGRPSGKLGHYSGQGSLGGWLRAVVNQLAIDRYRRSSKLVQTEDDNELDRLVSMPLINSKSMPGSNPEHILADNQAAHTIESILSEVIKGLSSEERLLIKLYYVDNLRLREIGIVLGVHEATASRKLSRLHADIRGSIEEMLIKRKGWTKEEIALNLSTTISHLETDLNQLLATEAHMTSKRLASICFYFFLVDHLTRLNW
jgi:RNA polymerase sigma-70 factor